MELTLIGLLLINLGLLVILIARKPVARVDTTKLEERLIRVEGQLDKLTPKIEDAFRENRREITTNLQDSRKELSDNLQLIQKTVDTRVKSLQDDNSKKLEEMRLTVDEKLQKSVEERFNNSFKHISGQLTQVYQKSQVKCVILRTASVT